MTREPSLGALYSAAIKIRITICTTPPFYYCNHFTLDLRQTPSVPLPPVMAPVLLGAQLDNTLQCARKSPRFRHCSFKLPLKYNLSTIRCFVTVEMRERRANGEQLRAVATGSWCGPVGPSLSPPPGATPASDTTRPAPLRGATARARETRAHAPLLRPPPRPQPMSGLSGEGAGPRW